MPDGVLVCFGVFLIFLFFYLHLESTWCQVLCWHYGDLHIGGASVHIDFWRRDF